MKVVENEDHLKALPLLCIVRSAAGRVCSRNEVAQWHSMGSAEPVTWAEADFPAKVVWDYAQEIGDPATEALAQLGVALISQQVKAQGDAPQAEAPPITNGAAPLVAVAPPVPPPAPEPPAPIEPTEVIVPGEAPTPAP